MDADQVAQLLASFQTIATSNQQMMERFQATTGTGTTPTTQAPTQTRDAAANVALTSIKVPLNMGENAEERLVNFYGSVDEVRDKMTVARVPVLVNQSSVPIGR